MVFCAVFENVEAILDHLPVAAFGFAGRPKLYEDNNSGAKIFEIAPVFGQFVIILRHLALPQRIFFLVTKEFGHDALSRNIYFLV